MDRGHVQPELDAEHRPVSTAVTAALAARAEEAFRDFIAGKDHPCLGARSAFRLGGQTLRVYGSLGSPASATRLAADLSAFVAGPLHDTTRLVTFVAIFSGRAPRDEVAFERRLWAQLQLLHELDASDVPWDPQASDDPADPHFSFSFGGQACFVAGLHPHSSRIARRFRWPALVFNPRVQFERLRADGRYDRLRDRIREREIALQGSVNPNLADFGERSEARQYSGRETEPGWQCPFHRKTP